MRRLLLLRHAKAARQAGGGDRERPLTSRGRQDAARLGAYLTDQKIFPNLGVASSAKRTRETLDCVISASERHFKTIYDPELYLAEGCTLLAELHKAPDIVQTMLVVAHNPGVTEFATRMCASGDPVAPNALEIKYPTCGLAIIDFGDAPWSALVWGQGALTRFITPSMLSDEAEDSD